MEPIVRERTRVRTATGDLDARIHYLPSAVPQPRLVLVDGAGDGTADGWGYARCQKLCQKRGQPKTCRSDVCDGTLTRGPGQ